MKKENIEKIAKVIAEDYGVSDKVGYYLADVTVRGLDEALSRFPMRIIGEMVENSNNEE